LGVAAEVRQHKDLALLHGQVELPRFCGHGG
jgi:hypothetical protein